MRFLPSFRQWSDRRWLVVIGSTAGLALLTLIVSLALALSGWRSGPQVQFQCESCGHSWRDVVREANVCPKCRCSGATRLHYRCPTCSTVFAGLERLKVGVGQYKYRLPGQKEWSAQLPEALVCPSCKLSSADFYNCAAPAPGGRDVDNAPRLAQ